MTVEKMRHPGGDTQTLDPRPLPATCVDAQTVNPVESLDKILGFLIDVSI